MELWVGLVVVVLLVFGVAPRIGLARPQTRGLTAVQTVAAIAGLVLAAVWYVVDRPDAARLKFDQAVTTAALPGPRVLVIAELTISNVGGHPAELDDQAYYVLVQRVNSPLADPAPAAAKPPVQMADAYNWPLEDLLAYRIGGHDQGAWKKTAPGLSGEIAPAESENFYLRAVVPCAPGERISVSSRVEKPRSAWRRFRGQPALVWIKQSFVDLSDLCKPAAAEPAAATAAPAAKRKASRAKQPRKKTP